MPIIDALPQTLLAFDTDVFSHLRNRQPYIQAKLKTYFLNTRQLPALPAITVFESINGIDLELSKRKITDDEASFRKQRIRDLTEQHQILNFNEKTAEIASFVCSKLGKSKSNEHWYDIFIVATAVSHNYGLATQNKKHMELIANHLPKDLDLRLAIWKP
jgi:predicted nucleic acid-binding protein